MKTCPLCNTSLTPKDIGTVEVDECGQCGGIWFDKGEFSQTRDHTDEDLKWMDFDIWKHRDRFQVRESPRLCPNCRIPMTSLRYGQTEVEIEYCDQCQGIWLDNGEFSRIVERLENELVSKSLSDYLKESLAEAREIVTGPRSFISEWKDFLTFLRMMEYRLFVEKPSLMKAILNIQKANPF